MTIMIKISSLLILLFFVGTLNVSVAAKDLSSLTSKQAKVGKQKYLELRRQGVDEVGHTAEAAAMRAYQLRKKKRKGIFRKREASLSQVLFPGVSPVNYVDKDIVQIFTDLVNSKKTHIPFEFYDLPYCKASTDTELTGRFSRQKKNLGSRLQGIEMKPAPFTLRVKHSHGCKVLCDVNMGEKKLKWMRKLIQRQYRVHLTFDQLPVLMRSRKLNYAVRGYPIGFVSSAGSQEGKTEFFLYNHLKFTIFYQEDSASFEGIRITGFDVHPVSKQHTKSTCDGVKDVANEPGSYQILRQVQSGDKVQITFSYEVQWTKSDLQWADRWDVYLIGSPDDDVHFFAIFNSLMIVLFLTGAIATIMIRTLRKDIAGYNQMQGLEEAQEETGWKLVHADVFRPPTTSPMMLSVLVGCGSQIGLAIFLSMLLATLKLLNPLKKGQTLTAILVLYVLCGSVAGYFSARIYKYCNAQAWKVNTLYTACCLPGLLVSIFCILNIFLSFAGASTAVSFLTILAIFALWLFVSTPLVFLGSYLGFRAEKFTVPTKVTHIARQIPEVPIYSRMPYSMFLGGILPFGAVCIELFFIMSALWLHQIYYVMGFLLVVILILTATCAEVAVVLCYLQLTAEDHRWWWNSFWNCAGAGFYLILYSVWFLISRLKLVGILPVVVYLTYMSMISLCFGMFCGAVGFITSFWFNKSIYGALKVD
mmetsp:Transcript_10256/g.15745  ORF Transcript_10256/g.15745 Transcript_10256/m.15745 type:complete len:702 (+) Transcript_10256:83-2188(+)